MKNSYVNILIESLKEKNDVLDEIAAADALQAELFKAEEPDLDAIRKSQDRIGELAERLNKLNEGFESVYGRVRGELQKNKELYRDEIITMQELISTITGKSVKIEAEQSRNRASAERYFKDRKDSLKGQRNTVQKINIYANQMHNVVPRGQIDATFLDKKK